MLIICVSFSYGQEKIVLWPQGAPMAKGKSDKDQPYLMAYFPEKKDAMNSAVIIAPGGGYYLLADDHEGKQVAEWFNKRGVTAFILYYRLGYHSSGYTHPVPLMDADRAVRLVRANAAKWKLDPAKIGMLGFSAGGHLTATLGTHFKVGDPKAKDPLDRVSSRPDYLVLAYPVISFTAPYAHSGSAEGLLGPEPDPALKQNLSNELQVTSQTPPSFLVHTDEDEGVPPQNSISFYLALKQAGVPAELHIYEKGPHGLGLTHPDHPAYSSWPDRLEDWLRIRKVVE